MAEVVGPFPRARLAIVGEGPLRPMLESRIQQLGLRGHVQLLGKREDVPVLMAAADLFVFPSLFEGFAGALVEAMAMHKPCIASRFLGAEELTRGGQVACLVPPRSPADLSKAIVRLAGHREEAARLGEQAAEWARARYDIRLSVRAWEDLYLQLTQHRAACSTMWKARVRS
jgi:glycosyltransferase involved in cell wall biosynthesis